jgi:hypothetical protein
MGTNQTPTETDEINCKEPYALKTRPTVVENIEWTRLPPPANYHKLSLGLAINIGKLRPKHHA